MSYFKKSKRMLLCLFFLLPVCSFLTAAEEVKIVDNPGKPPGKKAGRIVQLEEVMRITDEEGDFYFKYPTQLKIAPDRSIFLVDENQFLRFDETGKFIANQFKKGQGPGECAGFINYNFHDNKIFIYTSRPHKIIVTGLNGSLLKEYRADHTMGFLEVVGLFEDKYWFLGTIIGSILKENTGEITIELELSCVTPAGKIEKTGLLIPQEWYIVKKESHGGRFMISFNRKFYSRFAMDRSGNLFVMNSQKYLIQRVDLDRGKITGKFRREYTSIPYKDKISKDGTPVPRIPRPDYFTDVQHLLLNKEEIWAMTSTVLPGKGVLVDVFSKEGKYRDNFYLKLPHVTNVHDLRGMEFTLSGNFLFIIEKDEDENSIVVKYKIIL